MTYFKTPTTNNNSSIAERVKNKLLTLENAILDFGLNLKSSSDFKEFREAGRNIEELSELTGVFDDRYCDINADNGFWVQACNQKGKIIHRQALRFDDLSDTTLAQHWRNQAELYSPAGYTIDFEKCDFDTAPATHTISGRVCYHGEVWLEKEHRRSGLAPIMSKYGILTALEKFSPDFIYGLIPQKLVERGWAARQGYLHIHPWAPRWYNKDEDTFYDEYFAWVSGLELIKLWTARQRNIDVLGLIGANGDHGYSAAQEKAGQ